MFLLSCHGTDLIPDRTELGPVPGRHNLRHDVAAKGRADLNQVRILLHLQHGAVSRKAGPEPGRCPGRQGAPGIGGSHQHGGRFYLPDKILKHIGIGKHVKISQARMVIKEYPVRAVSQKRFRLFFHPASHYKDVNRMSNLFCQLPCLSQKFQCNRVDGLPVMLRINSNPPPFLFIHGCGRLFLHPPHNALRSLLYTQAAHPAGSRNGQAFPLPCNCTKGTERLKLLCGFRCHLILVYL